MKRINDKVRYRIEHEQAHLYARLKGSWTRFATCHPATIPLLKADGIQKHSHLIRLV
jgi:hypothetical protein